MVFEVPSKIAVIRRIGGLLFLLQNLWLGTAEVEQVIAEGYALGVHVIFADPYIIFCNIYAPLFSDDCPNHLALVLSTFIHHLQSSYPQDAIILGSNPMLELPSQF